MNVAYLAKRLADLEAKLVAQSIELAQLRDRVERLEPRKPGRPRKDVETD